MKLKQVQRAILEQLATEPRKEIAGVTLQNKLVDFYQLDVSNLDLSADAGELEAEGFITVKWQSSSDAYPIQLKISPRGLEHVQNEQRYIRNCLKKIAPHAGKIFCGVLIAVIGAVVLHYLGY